METQNNTKAIPQAELIKLSNNFGRLLKLQGGFLLGVDGRKIKSLDRSRPQVICIGDYSFGHESNKKRHNGTESPYKFKVDGEIRYLTHTERDLLLGSNYQMVDCNYAGPSAGILQEIFSADGGMARGYHNAFEFGLPHTEKREDGSRWKTLPITYHKIAEERFRELRNYNFDKKDLISRLREERQTRQKVMKGGNE